VQGMQAHPQMFEFVENSGKSYEISEKLSENFHKIDENPSKTLNKGAKMEGSFSYEVFFGQKSFAPPKIWLLLRLCSSMLTIKQNIDFD